MELRTPKTTADMVMIEQRMRMWRILAALGSVIILVLVGYMAYQWAKDHEGDLGLSRVDSHAPEAQKIKKLIQPLRYNFIPRLLMPEVRLAMSLPQERWYLLQVRSYDAAGRIRLTDGRFGVCGDLAAYTLEHIQEMLAPRYDIEYVRVDESNFFFAPESTHYALKITDRNDPTEGQFILDPSFRRYGPISQFDDYLFRKNIRRVRLLEQKATYDVYAAGEFTPILIRRDYMLGLSVRRVNHRWDLDNYEVALISALRHRYNAHYILALRKSQGKKEYFEDSERALRVLSKNEYANLRRRTIELFEGISLDAPKDPPPPKTFTTRSLWNMRPEEIQERLSTLNPLPQ